MQIQEQVCLLERLEQHQKPAGSPVESDLLILGQILLQMWLRANLLFALMLAGFHLLFQNKLRSVVRSAKYICWGRRKPAMCWERLGINQFLCPGPWDKIFQEHNMAKDTPGSSAWIWGYGFPFNFTFSLISPTAHPGWLQPNACIALRCGPVQ